MLSHWFERGLGQVVAPDDKYVPDDNDEGLLAIVAPEDPGKRQERRASLEGKSAKKKVPPKSAFLSPPQQIRCQHCQQWTPIRGGVGVGDDESSPQPHHECNNDSSFQTPQGKLTNSSNEQNSSQRQLLSPLHARVLECAVDTAESLQSPPSVTEARNRVLCMCANNKELNDKLASRLRKLLEKEPTLLQCRSSQLGSLVPDGYTPLMVSSARNLVLAVKIILEAAKKNDTLDNVLSDVDMQGRTALHIAAQHGALDVIELLMGATSSSGKPEGDQAPLDLMGQTPFGRAVVSNEPTAQKQRKKLQTALFSPGDKSIYGEQTPAKTRLQSYATLQAIVGRADMPGFRVKMEDSISMHDFPNSILVGVCDGHGDAGLVSKFVANEIGQLLLDNRLEDDQENGSLYYTTLFQSACLELDARLQKTKRAGGSTAVWALVTQMQIVVANVGDSRCILIQRADQSAAKSEEKSLEEDMAKLSVDDKGEETTKGSDEPMDTESSETSSANNVSVVVLSNDHKPNLPAELERMEKAGLSVLSETFQDEDGVEHTICKVQKSETDRLAVSRAFGDFEYKTNQTLAAEEQAVVAVPELVVRERDADRDMYLVLACDGIWDVMNNEEVGDFVASHVEELVMADDCLPRVADLLLDECLRRGSKDNMTVIVVALSKAAERLGLPEAIAVRRIDF
jgi:serine/threonine protein phosphatase PrpC